MRASLTVPIIGTGLVVVLATLTLGALATLTLGVLATITLGVLTTVTGAAPAARAVDESPPQTSNDRIAVNIMLRFFIVYFWLELTSLDMAFHGPQKLGHQSFSLVRVCVKQSDSYFCKMQLLNALARV